MEWVFYALGAMLLWTVVNILDKYIISHELRDPTMVMIVFGFVIYLVFIVAAFVFGGPVALPLGLKYAAILAGICYSIALWFYYHVMQKEELTRFVPIMAMEPFVIAIIAFFMFDERFKWLNYLGMLLIVGGAIVITIKKYHSKIRARYLLVFALLAVLFFAIRNILFKYATQTPDYFWPVMFWAGVGGILLPILLFIFHPPHLRKKGWEGVYHLAFNAVLSGAAVILFAKAITIGTVSLSSALVGTKPLIVFIIVTFLSFFHPKIMRERHSPAVLIKKSIATILIVIGGVLILM